MSTTEQNYNWAKALLLSYRFLPKIVKVLRDGLDMQAMSGYGGRHFMQGISTEKLYESMIQMNYRISGLINVKVLVDTSLEKLPTKYTKLIKLRYILDMGTNEVAATLGISRRTYFRQLKSAISLIGVELAKLGYNEEKLYQEYGNEQFLKRFYEEAFKDNDDKEEPIIEVQKTEFQSYENLNIPTEQFASIGQYGNNSNNCYTYAM